MDSDSVYLFPAIVGSNADLELSHESRKHCNNYVAYFRAEHILDWAYDMIRFIIHLSSLG